MVSVSVPDKSELISDGSHSPCDDHDDSVVSEKRKKKTSQLVTIVRTAAPATQQQQQPEIVTVSAHVDADSGTTQLQPAQRQAVQARAEVQILAHL